MSDTKINAYMESQFSRTELLVGKNALQKLASATVAVFGIGGVGGFTAEALARAGIGTLVLIDNDSVALSNCNRQITALHSTVGRSKVQVMKERILDINPQAKIYAHELFFSAETTTSLDFSQFDYIADAIDTISSKILLAEIAHKKNIPIISSMGAGNKLYPQLFEVADIYQTSVCPLARVMRYELKKRGITALKTVYSKEKPLPSPPHAPHRGNTPVPASISFVPSTAGLIMAGEIVRELIQK